MKIRRREKMRPVCCVPGDSIALLLDERVIMQEKIERKMIIDEALVFDVEPEDFAGIADGIGGAFLSSKGAELLKQKEEADES